MGDLISHPDSLRAPCVSIDNGHKFLIFTAVRQAGAIFRYQVCCVGFGFQIPAITAIPQFLITPDL